MDIKIIQRTKNPALHREEIGFEIKDSKATPARKDILQKLASLAGSKSELVVITKIKTGFGSTAVTGTAVVYSDTEAMEKTVKKHLIARTAGKKKEGEETEKKQEKPAQAKDEKPAEKKEEQKPEAMPAEKKEEK